MKKMTIHFLRENCIKQSSKFISILIFVFSFIPKLNAQATVSAPVLEALASTSLYQQVTQVLNSIDQLYAIYDQINHNITMIEQQYEQMQFYCERAASWKFDEIEWDGDLDFRNEIMNATSQVNRQLTNIRRLKNSFTQESVFIGDQSYSLASLCGLDDGNGGGNIQDMISKAVDTYGTGIKNALKTDDITESDAMILWNKYGLTPENYLMVSGIEDKIDEKLTYLIGGAIEDSAEVQEIDKEKAETISAIMEMFGSENLTETEVGQLQGMLLQQNLASLKDLEKLLREIGATLAYKMVLERQQEQAEKDSYNKKMAEQEKNTLPSYMY